MAIYTIIPITSRSNIVKIEEWEDDELESEAAEDDGIEYVDLDSKQEDEE